MGGFLLRKWILAAAIMALPTYALAQVQSGVQGGLQSGEQSGVRSGVLSGFDHRQSPPEKMHRLGYPYSSCWRATVLTRGVTRVWNCQPYLPP
jgi:hypothetical protein